MYLDARRTEWQAYERAGSVRYTRLSGQRKGRVFVAPTASDIIPVLIGPFAAHAENRRPAKTEALPR